MTHHAPTDTRTALLDAAARCLVIAGINATTMEDIAREAGAGKTTLYRYFSNKDAVVDALVDRERDRFERLLRAAAADQPPGTHAVREAFLAGLGFLRTHPMLTKSLATEPDRLLPYLTTRSGPIATAGVEVFAHLVEAGIAAGRLRRDLDIGWTAETLFRLLLSFFTVPRIILDLEDDDAVRAYADGLVAGLGAPTGERVEPDRRSS